MWRKVQGNTGSQATDILLRYLPYAVVERTQA